ncbi:hypothetical protein QE152_g23665 [Popillia japonica]|uniref:Uncharacterized protein n=1 Tax=Popillia japonica TaxID=7064 RepID=A0AAW1KHP7_POPJA
MLSLSPPIRAILFVLPRATTAFNFAYTVVSHQAEREDKRRRTIGLPVSNSGRIQHSIDVQTVLTAEDAQHIPLTLDPIKWIRNEVIPPTPVRRMSHPPGLLYSLVLSMVVLYIKLAVRPSHPPKTLTP